jgi:hypothetical protein
MYHASFEDEVYSEWTQSVDEVASANLEKPLLIRNPDTSFISVNFDPKVCPEQ